MKAKGWLVISGVILVLVVLVWRSIANRPTYPDVNSPRPLKGGVEALVAIEEFSDFQCPACKAAQPVVQEVLQTFGDRIQLTYRHFPLSSVHPLAFNAALAAECANDQGKFWEYHDKLFDAQPQLSENDLKSYAAGLGLDTEKFNACLGARAKKGVVRSDIAEADKRNVNSTPSFFVDGEYVRDWSKLKESIQAKLVGG